MSTQEENVKTYLRAADPLCLWQTVMGCSPIDTDLMEDNSSAVHVLDAAIERFQESLSHSDIGFPFEIGEIQLDEEGAEILRQKFFTAATLAFSAESSFSNRIEGGVSTPSASPAIFIAAAGDMMGAIKAVAPSTPDKIFNHLKNANEETADVVYAFSEAPYVRISLLPEEDLAELFQRLTLATVLDFLRNGDQSTLSSAGALRTLGDKLPASFELLNADNLLRLEAIAQFCGRKVDETGQAVSEVIKGAPYYQRFIKQAVQDVYNRLDDSFASYGLKLCGNTLEGLYGDSASMSPILYRLLGEEGSGLKPIGVRPVVSLIEIGIPDPGITEAPVRLVLKEEDSPSLLDAEENGFSHALVFGAMPDCMIERPHTITLVLPGEPAAVVQKKYHTLIDAQGQNAEENE